VPLRTLILSLGLMGLTACASGTVQDTSRDRNPPQQTTEQARGPATQAAPARGPARATAPTRPQLRAADILGQTPADIDAQIGAPDLVRREGNGELRVYRNAACILHIFAYPNGGVSRATYLEARTGAGRLTGETRDDCVAKFGAS